MANQWLRLWHDMPNDPKWRTVARVSGESIALVISVFVHLMVDASRNVTRGHACVTTEDLASALDVTDAQIEAVLSAMQGRVLDGMHLLGWDGRQPKREDEGDPGSGAKSAAERKREQRARERQSKQGAESGGVTESHEASREVTLDTDKDKEVNHPSLRSGADDSAGQGDAPSDREDPDKAIHALVWEQGLPLLTSKGVSDRSARSLLGKLCKAAGDLEALAVVEAMREANPGEPASWLSAAIKARDKANAGSSFGDFLAACRAADEKAISDYSPLLAYVEAVRLPREFLEIAWAEFKRRHLPDGAWAKTRRDDWRRTFRIAVETNALRLWTLIVTTAEAKRHEDQNKHYWGHVLTPISEQAWVAGRQFGKDVWHEHYAELYAAKLEFVLPTGEICIRRKSTTEMGVKEFAEYVRRVQADAASKHGVLFEEE
jgi:hypothetical protein